MSHTIRFARLAQTAALALVLAAPLGATAFAQSAQDFGAGQNTAFGANDDHSIRAAEAPRLNDTSNYAALANEFKLGENTAFGAGVAPQPGNPQAVQENARLAALGHVNIGSRDLVGDGGAQDRLAREMFPATNSANDW